MKISLLSTVLVLLQFSCIGILLYTGPVFPANTAGLVLFTMAMVIALATTYAFRQSKLTVFPEPRRNATLISSGIFAYIRHPYYSSVLLYAAAMLTAHCSYWRLAVAITLLLVIARKMVHEEKLLCQHFPDYAAYRQRTKKLIPFVW